LPRGRHTRQMQLADLQQLLSRRAVPMDPQLDLPSRRSAWLRRWRCLPWIPCELRRAS